jgi:dihydropteroate synthase
MDAQQFQSWLLTPKRTPLVWGIVNVTPDSFSDGGKCLRPEDAIAAALRLIAEGADVLDLGAESTRPGAAAVSAGEQVQRLLPVVRGIARQSPVALSLDTTSAEVARRMLGEGASIINDISAGRFDAGMLPLASQSQSPIVLMHMQGTPQTMQAHPQYDDVLAEVKAFLAQRRDAAEASGIERHRVILDPGIGFGKTTNHNLALLRQLPALASLGQPLLVGASRKRFIGEITGVSAPEQRVHGSVAAAVHAVANGAAIVRVHDVAATVAAVRLLSAIAGA